LLSDNGRSYISADLAEWLDKRDMGHVRAPCHPQTQGKIERWHQTLKYQILLENYQATWKPRLATFASPELVLASFARLLNAHHLTFTAALRFARHSPISRSKGVPARTGGSRRWSAQAAPMSEVRSAPRRIAAMISGHNTQFWHG
jgi:hypothetical protein